MARVESFQPREILGVGFDCVGKLREQAAALGSARTAPRGKCLAGSFDGSIDIGRPRFRHFGENAVVVRIRDRNASAFNRIHKVSTNK